MDRFFLPRIPVLAKVRILQASATRWGFRDERGFERVPMFDRFTLRYSNETHFHHAAAAQGVSHAAGYLHELSRV
jgi:hypothetical protein